jgi:hypothetical protein
VLQYVSKVHLVRENFKQLLDLDSLACMFKHSNINKLIYDAFTRYKQGKSLAYRLTTTNMYVFMCVQPRESLKAVRCEGCLQQQQQRRGLCAKEVQTEARERGP